MRKQINKNTSTYRTVLSCFSELQIAFSTSEFTWKDATQILNTPTRHIMINLAVKAGQIIKPRRGAFRLPAGFDPYLATETTMQYNRISTNKSNNRRRKKDYTHPVQDPNYTDPIIPAIENNSIDFMVKFLKSKGYKVLKPTTTFEEL